MYVVDLQIAGKPHDNYGNALETFAVQCTVDAFIDFFSLKNAVYDRLPKPSA